MSLSNETKPVADRIEGNAKENVMFCIAELVRLSNAMTDLQFEAIACQRDYCKALDQNLPEAGDTLQEAAERSIKIYERLQVLMTGRHA